MTIDSSEVAATFTAAQALTGPENRGAGPEDVFAEDGYDESQRAEILEVEGTGPTDGVIQTDLQADLGGPDPDEDEIEDEEDVLDSVEDTDAPFEDDSDVLKEQEQGSERLLPADADELASRDDGDFDVDDEEAGDTPGQLGS